MYNKKCQTNLINVNVGVLFLFIGIAILFFSYNKIILEHNLFLIDYAEISKLSQLLFEL